MMCSEINYIVTFEFNIIIHTDWSFSILPLSRNTVNHHHTGSQLSTIIQDHSLSPPVFHHSGSQSFTIYYIQNQHFTGSHPFTSFF